jgi:hypothetical protein
MLMRYRGYNPVLVQETVGHADAALTHEFYGRPAPALLAEAARKPRLDSARAERLRVAWKPRAVARLISTPDKLTILGDKQVSLLQATCYRNDEPGDGPQAGVVEWPSEKKKPVPGGPSPSSRSFRVLLSIAAM